MIPLENEGPEHNRRQKRYMNVLSVRDIAMGLFFIIASYFFYFPKKVGENFAQYDDAIFKVFAGIILIYGIFRIYRGIKQNYYN